MEMKQIMFRGAALGLLLVLTACGGGGSRTREQRAAPQTADAAAMPAVVGVDSLLADAASLVGRQVRIEGVCTHICKHGGRKIFLMGSAPRRLLRIEAGERIGSFSPECVNRPVRVTGTVCESRIDEAYLAAWEARLRSGEGERHGDGEGGCTTEKQARGELLEAGAARRIADFRRRIAEREAREGKAYLSFYHVEGSAYEIVE